MELKFVKKEIIKWSVYWAAVIAVYITASLIFGDYGLYALILALAAINFIIRLALILPFKRLSIKCLKIAIVVMLNLLITVGLVFLIYVIVVSGTNYNIRYIDSLDYTVFEHNSTYAYDKETGVYTVSSVNDEFKILQLTDTHICAGLNTISTDRKAFDACYELIKEAQPDLIVVTGDIVYPIPIQTFNIDNLKPMYQFFIFMNKVGISWTMVYGNHDTEVIAEYDGEYFQSFFSSYISQDLPMLYADKTPDIYGRYNQYIRVENKDGSLNRVLFLIDSNDYVKGSLAVNDYDSVHADQIQWYSDTVDALSNESGETIRSFVFMHIPFKAFADAQKCLEAGDTDKAEYLFGQNQESVSCPDKDTGFFDKILEKQSTDAVFVGHDHLNNMGIKYMGVDLVYSKSIDYIAYPGIASQTAQRGATLVTLFGSGDYSIKQLDYEK